MCFTNPVCVLTGVYMFEISHKLLILSDADLNIVNYGKKIKHIA